MAQMKKDCSLHGIKATAESISKAPSKTLIIPGKELVQVSAKVLLHSCIIVFETLQSQMLFLLVILLVDYAVVMLKFQIVFHEL